ncbi:MAG: hypothetical protein KA444_00550 [Bacteroidia bacterium]|nr:hypothetical protein [Bacteroidia bacterium]
MILNSKKLFLLDSLGALLSTFLLGVVLVSYQSHFGMPVSVLYFLSGIAAIFFAYSFLCYLIPNENWRPFLKLIAIANLLYAFLSFGLVLYFKSEITPLGWIYFLAEVIVIAQLVRFELKIALKQ